MFLHVLGDMAGIFSHELVQHEAESMDVYYQRVHRDPLQDQIYCGYLGG